MTDDKVRGYLRAALDEVIAQETVRLSRIHDAIDAEIEERIKKMRPLIEALDALRQEVGPVEGVEISPAAHGHMATVRLRTSVSREVYSVTTNRGNTLFEIEEQRGVRALDWIA